MKAFFAGIVAAIATLFGGTSQAPLALDSMPAAAATAVTTHTVTPGFAASDPASATTTVVNNYVTSPVVERVLETHSLNTSVLDEKIQALRNDMLLRIAQVASPAINFSGPAASTPVSVASFAASQNIDSLNNVTLTNVTVTGVAGLTDGDVPDSITASNYLSLAGGSLTFGSSTLFSVFNNAYFGATATSSFDSAGTLTLATPLLVSSGGTGWTNINAGSILFGNGSSAIATSSSLYWDNTNTRLGIGTTTPWANLSIQAADNAPNPQFVVGSSTATSLIVTSSGNVGIGTTTPGAKLSIQNGSIGFYDATGVLHATMGPGAAGSSNKQLYVAAFTATTSARDIFDNWAIFYFAGSQNKIQLGHNGTGAWIGGGGSSLNFANAINSTSNPAMTIAGSNVGIGSTTPYAKLSVKGAGATTGVNFRTTNSSNSPLFTILDSGAITAAGAITSTAVTANTFPYASTTAITVSGTSWLNGGLLTLASSTIGNGTQAGGLTISGGATTTGNAYFAGNVGIGTQPSGTFTIKTSTADNSATDFHLNNSAGANLLSIRNDSSTTLGSGTQNTQFAIAGSGANAGIFSPNYSPGPAETMGFKDYANGTTRMFADFTSGVDVKFGINKTSSLSENLYVQNYYGGTNTAIFTVASTTATNGSTANTILTALASGNIGIGTTGPAGALHVASTLTRQLLLNRTEIGTAATDGTYLAADDIGDLTVLNQESGNFIFGTNNAERMRITASGNVGIGTTTPYTRLTVWGPDTAVGTAAFLIVNSASTTEFAVYDDGSATLAGTLTQNSDVRLKINVESLNASSTLGQIAQLNPVAFHWADPAKSMTPQLGFIAQDVQKVFPQLVSTTSPTARTPDGTLGLNYIGFIAPIVEAIKALMAELHDLSTTVANFAESFTSKQITATNELCVADNASDPQPVCITKSQLAALLSQSAAAGFANPSPTSPTPSPANPTPAPSQPQDTEPPVITINGNNPATINVGDTYNDLGATVTDNADKNLDIHTYVGTTPIEQAVIDTSAAATYHIYYVATDGTGNTATSTRSVIVESVDASPPPINDASSTAPALAQ